MQSGCPPRVGSITKLRYRRGIFNPEDPVGPRANPLKVKASPVYICRRPPGLPPRVTIPSKERQLLSERPRQPRSNATAVVRCTAALQRRRSLLCVPSFFFYLAVISRCSKNIKMTKRRNRNERNGERHLFYHFDNYRMLVGIL